MNKDEFSGKWKQMQGQFKEWWGKLTDDDLQRVGGQYDQMIGVVQEKYGYTRERVEKELAGRMAKFEADRKNGETTAAHDVWDGKWKQIQGQARQWWGKLTDDDLERAGGKAEQVIGLLQEKYGYTRAHAEEEFNKRVAEAKASKANENSVPTL